MKIKFCGAATNVTGSCHLITSGDHKILLDCGQFQGGKTEERKNFEDFPFNPKEIECVILSHAHIDHCGRLPLLVKKGFKGKIYCTKPTGDLLEIMLRDSGYIHEKEAEWKNKKNLRKGRPLEDPLYTVKDAEESLKYIEPILYDQLININDDMRIVFNDAGHILGSAITELWITENGKTAKVVYSGDLGVPERPILRDPTIIKSADIVIMESTYGNRIHPKNQLSVSNLIKIVINTRRRGGNTIIPSFAVGRTQELIYEFNKLYTEDNEFKKELDKVNVYIDSPMATRATQVFRDNAQVYDEEAREFLMNGENPLDFPGLKFTKTTEESQALNTDKTPKIIISASGMCDAGRIRHHLKHNLWNPKSSIVFVGYQAQGTLGRRILDGEKDVALFGEPIHIQAEIHNLEGFSGHADREGLLHWVEGFQSEPKQIFLVHGEEQSKHDLATTIESRTGYKPHVIEAYSEYELETAELLSASEVEEKIIDEEEFEALKKRLVDIHEDLEKVLYNTSLSMHQNLELEKLANINNQLLEIEKSTMDLSSAISEKG